MIDKILIYMCVLAFIMLFAGAGAMIWSYAWEIFEGTAVGQLFVEWLKERKRNERNKSKDYS